MKTALEYLTESAERTAEGTRTQMVREMRALADRLVYEAEKLEADSDRLPNSLGEVQSRGPEVDRLCALLAEQTGTAAQLRRLVENGTV